MLHKLTEKEKKRRRRDNKWYGRWANIAKLLKKNKKEQIIVELFRFIDNAGGHCYRRVAYSSLVDMRLAIEDCLNKNCEECEKRFKCFTE